MLFDPRPDKKCKKFVKRIDSRWMVRRNDKLTASPCVCSKDKKGPLRSADVIFVIDTLLSTRRYVSLKAYKYYNIIKYTRMKLSNSNTPHGRVSKITVIPCVTQFPKFP